MIVELDDITDQHLSDAAVGSYVENRHTRQTITRQDHGWVYDDGFDDQTTFDIFDTGNLRDGDVLHLVRELRPVSAFIECPHCGYKFQTLPAHLGQDHGLEVAP